MEAATLFTLSSIFSLRSGVVCAVYANRIKDEFKPGMGEESRIRVANEAARILAEWDKKKEDEDRKLLFPSVLKHETEGERTQHLGHI